MGTRGFVGFVIDDEEKIAYNHFDSYPGGVGAHMLSWLTKAVEDMPKLREDVSQLTVISHNDPDPTPAQIEQLREFTDMSVGGSGGTGPEWYQVLRDTQGKPELMLRAGYIEDAREFPLDSLFCEWGYLVDLDTGCFEVYKGFQNEPPDEGRWSGQGTINERAGVAKYYAVNRVASWPLWELPTEVEFHEALRQDDEEEE